MSRLSTLPSRVQLAPSRVATLQQSERRVTGSTLQARRRRRYAENPRCARCGKPRLLDEMALDHTVALVNGGADTYENTQLLCHEPCHAEKTLDDLRQARGQTGSV